MGLTRFLGVVLVLAALTASAQGQTSVTLAWNRCAGTNVAFYKLYYGVASRTYTNASNVGNATNATISSLISGKIYYIAATACNTSGLESDYSTEIVYTNPVATAPTIVLSSPVSGASYTAPASISLAATVTANGHTITKVQFYNGAALLAEDASAPYSFVWTNVSAGSYSLTARTVYDSGSTVASSSANVTVTTGSLPSIALSSPANGATYTAPATIPLAASVTANGHTITKVQFYNGATLIGQDTTAPYDLTWTNVSAGSYSLSASLIYDAGSTAASSPVSIAVTGLPAPWQTTDIGSLGVAGSASMSNGLYTVRGAGNISGTADNFRFVYQPLSSDGEIKVRLNSVGNTGTSGRMGVMIRESLTRGSKYAWMGISPDGTFRWQRRSYTGFITSASTSTIGTPPNAWIRLVRTGNVLYGYKSTDGTNWTLVKSGSITMATNIYVGLAVASGSSSALNTATFTNMTVVP
jgi:sulfur relay (sulfurtransferase) complex TusBCD TusD component (DsrE family)